MICYNRGAYTVAMRILDWNLHNNKENEIIGSISYKQPVSRLLLLLLL